MFAETLKKLRTQRGITQDRMAENLGVPYRTYGSWERGEREPDFATLGKIADFYGVSTDYLLGRVDIEVKKETPPAKAEGVERIEVKLPVNPTKTEVNTAFRELLQELVRQEVQQQLESQDNRQ